MPRNQSRRVLQPGLAFEERLGYVTDLSDDRNRQAEEQQLPGAEIPSLTIEHEFAECERGDDPAERAADGTGVRLLRRQNGGELRTAYGCTDGHGGGVADPGDDEREEGQEHIRGRPRQRLTAVADGDQERQHAGRIDAAEQRDRYACERTAHRTPSRHRDDQRDHQPDGSQIERRPLGPKREQRDRRRGKPTGALERLDPLAATEIVDLVSAEHAEDRQRDRERPAANPDDHHDQRDGDGRHDDALHQIVGG